MADKKKYRRSNGEGSVFKHQNGKWCGQIALGVNEEGKRVRKTIFGDTRADVVDQLKELSGSINAKKLKPSINTKLGHFMEKWLVDFKRPTVSPRTYEWYLNMAKSIPEDLKALHLQKVNSYQVQNMLNTLKNEGLSVRSVKAAYDLLNQVYKAAVEFELVGENPLDKVKITRKETNKKQKALSVEERKKVLVAIETSGTYKPIIYIMIGMGLRIGETIALKWRDINFDSNTISINKAAKSTPKISNEGLVLGRSMEISGTKTACSERTLPIPLVVKENLIEWKATYSEKFKNMETEDLVFPNKSGELRCYSGFRRQFERFLKEKGITDVTFHQFRHYVES